jgi:hypothetical protein
MPQQGWCQGLQQSPKGPGNILVVTLTVLVKPELVVVLVEFSEELEGLGAEPRKGVEHGFLLKPMLQL